MANDLLKRALMEAQKIEMAKLPTEDELSNAHMFSDAFNAKMDKLIVKTKNKYVYLGNLQIRKVAVAAIIFILVSGASMSVEAVRRPIVNFFIEVYEKFTKLSFENEDKIILPITIEKFYLPEEIPKGYSKLEENNGNTFFEIVYSDSINEIVFQQFTLTYAYVGLDTENVDMVKINIQGHDGWTYANKNTTVILWNDGEYAFMLTGMEDLSSLEHMANSIKIKK